MSKFDAVNVAYVFQNASSTWSSPALPLTPPGLPPLRNFQTGLVYNEKIMNLPIGTRSINVQMNFIGGSNVFTSFVDNISVVIFQ
jgi:hypothetical protein